MLMECKDSKLCNLMKRTGKIEKASFKKVDFDKLREVADPHVGNPKLFVNDTLLGRSHVKWVMTS